MDGALEDFGERRERTQPWGRIHSATIRGFPPPSRGEGQGEGLKLVLSPLQGGGAKPEQPSRQHLLALGKVPDGLFPDLLEPVVQAFAQDPGARSRRVEPRDEDEVRA